MQLNGVTNAKNKVQQLRMLGSIESLKQENNIFAQQKNTKIAYHVSGTTNDKKIFHHKTKIDNSPMSDKIECH